MTPHVSNRIARALVGACAIATLLATGPRAAQAIEIVPSIGLSQGTDGSDQHTMFGLALRQSLVPRIQGELQVAHRSEELSYAGETLTMRTIPVTASVWASPVPMLYVGGGVGAYLQAVEYEGNVFPASNETNFGAHLGGGMRFSMTPMVGLDLQGRYVFMDEQATQLSSGNFDPSFWSVSAGLAIGF